MDHPASSVACRALPGSLAKLKPAVSLQTAKGTFFLFLPAKHVILSQFSGHIDRQAGEALRSFGNRQFGAGVRVRFFHDWEQVTGYDSEARIMLTDWAIESRAHIPGVVVLTRSKLVAMGVATANLATSLLGLTMRCHTQRDPFDKELLSVLAASHGPRTRA